MALKDDFGTLDELVIAIAADKGLFIAHSGKLHSMAYSPEFIIKEHTGGKPSITFISGDSSIVNIALDGSGANETAKTLDATPKLHGKKIISFSAFEKEGCRNYQITFQDGGIALINQDGKIYGMVPGSKNAAASNSGNGRIVYGMLSGKILSYDPQNELVTVLGRIYRQDIPPRRIFLDDGVFVAGKSALYTHDGIGFKATVYDEGCLGCFKDGDNLYLANASSITASTPKKAYVPIYMGEGVEDIVLFERHNQNALIGTGKGNLYSIPLEALKKERIHQCWLDDSIDNGIKGFDDLYNEGIFSHRFSFRSLLADKGYSPISKVSKMVVFPARK